MHTRVVQSRSSRPNTLSTSPRAVGLGDDGVRGSRVERQGMERDSRVGLVDTVLYEIFISAARNLFSPLEDLEEWPFIGLPLDLHTLLMDEIGFIGTSN